MSQRLLKWIVAAALLAPASLAAAQSEFSIDEYTRLRSEAEASLEVMRQTAIGDEAYRDNMLQALNDRVALITYLGDWIQAGMDPSIEGDALETRAVLYQNVVAIYAELGQCENAEDTLGQLRRFVEVTELGVVGDDALMEARAMAASCASDADADAEAPAGDPEMSSAPRQRRTTEWALIGTGAALVLGGTAVALGPYRSANDDVEAWNANPSADARANAEDAEASAQTWAYVAQGLWLGGAASLIGGTALFVLNQPNSDVQVGIAPGMTPTLFIGGTW